MYNPTEKICEWVLHKRISKHNYHVKSCLSSVIIREIQSKTNTHPERLQLECLTIPNVDKDVEQL